MNEKLARYSKKYPNASISVLIRYIEEDESQARTLRVSRLADA